MKVIDSIAKNRWAPGVFICLVLLAQYIWPPSRNCNQTTPWWQYALPFLVFIGFWIILMRKGRRNGR